MIVCRSCGHQNVAEAEFCASCRAYLAWDGDRVPAAGTPAPPPPPPPPPPEPERRQGLVDHVLSAVRAPGARGARPAEPTAPPGPPPHGAVPPGPPPDGFGSGPGLGARPAGWTPGPGGQPSSQPSGQPSSPPAGPQPVKPAPEQHLPPPEPVLPPPHLRRPGARYCTVCGADNDADRQLCRSCGAELLVPTAKRPPWWRRLFRRSGVAAGERPGKRRRGRSRIVRRIVRGTIAAVLILAVALLVGPFRGNVASTYRSLKAKVSTQYEPIKAVSAVGSSAARGHPASNAIDGVKDSAWAEGARGTGVKQSLTILLGRKVDLARIGITPGASDNEKKFRAQPRPHQIRLQFGGGVEQTITLTDTPTFQQFDVSAKGVDRVALVVLSVFPAQSGQDTSIAEVEFFSKK